MLAKAVDMYPGGDMIWMAAGWTVAVAVIAAVLWTLLTLIKAFRGLPHVNEPPEKVLKRRLVSGEIDLDEYTRRLAALSRTKRAA